MLRLSKALRLISSDCSDGHGVSGSSGLENQWNAQLLQQKLRQKPHTASHATTTAANAATAMPSGSSDDRFEDLAERLRKSGDKLATSSPVRKIWLLSTVELNNL